MALKALTETGSDLKDPRRDVQTTTFSIDGVARFCCNTWGELQSAKGARGFDIVIVGSGMYGAYLAAKLFQFGAELGPAAPRIVVLEAGPFLISEHVQNLTRVGDVGSLVFEPLVGPDTQRTILEPGGYKGAGNLSDHARCVGGKSLFWGGWTPRLIESDLRRPGSPWPTEVVDYLYQTGVNPPDIVDGYPFVEWEIGASESTDYIQGKLYDQLLQQAKNVFNSVQIGNETKLNEPLPPPVAVLGQAPDSGLFSFDHYSSLILLLDAIRRDSGKSDTERRLFLLPNAQATRVEVQDGAVTGVRLALIDRVNMGVRSQNKNAPKPVTSMETLTLNPGGCVVLAAQAIESTRLALNSFPRPAGLGGQLIGRNLMAHVRGNHVWQVKRSALGLPAGPLGNAAMHVPGISRKIATLQGQQGQFHFQFYASANVPPFSGSGPLNAEEYLRMLLPNFDEIQQIRAAQDPEMLAIGIRTCGEMFGRRDVSIPTSLAISWMNTPAPGVADELFVDQNGNVVESIPRPYVQLAETAEDQAVREDQTAAAFQFIAQLAGVNVSETGARFADRDAFVQSANKVRYITSSSEEQDGIGTTYHECGTLWMGENPYESVTDVHGRFHHLANAYSCDQSLFPTSGSANPVPTGLALARKVARGITQRFTSANTVQNVEPGFQLLYENNENDWASADAANFFRVTEAGQPPIIGAGVGSSDVALGVYWYTPKKFGDFELRLQWKVFSPIANGGVFFRAPQPTGNLFASGGFYATALEVQIDERGFDPDANFYGSPKHRTGALYAKIASNRWASRAISPRDGRPGFWNDYSIRVQAGNVEIRLNDELVCQGPHQAALNEGYIGVQCHTEVVQYRSLRIKEL